MKKYEDMSDGELNWKIWHVINKIPKGYATICIFNINNPADIMPIAIEYGISVICTGTAGGPTYSATNGFWRHSGTINGANIEIECNGSPYRAIAICFLKMMDGK